MPAKKLPIPIPTVHLTCDDPLITKSKSLVSKMMIPAPWHVPKIKKIGLFEIYIIDSVMELLEISAEKNTDDSLIDPNPVYQDINEALKTLIRQYLDSKPFEQRHGQFVKFYNLAELHCSKLKVDDIVHWTGLIPDIRTLDNPSDCLSWIYSVLVKDNMQY